MKRQPHHDPAPRNAGFIRQNRTATRTQAGKSSAPRAQQSAVPIRDKSSGINALQEPAPSAMGSATVPVALASVPLASPDQVHVHTLLGETPRRAGETPALPICDKSSGINALQEVFLDRVGRGRFTLYRLSVVCPAVVAAIAGLFAGGTLAEAAGAAAAGSAPNARVTEPPSALTALDRYVAAPDTNYTFKLLNTATTPVGKVHVLEMISQAWLTTNEVDRPRWQHWLTVAVPQDVAHRTALLFITGGSNDKGPPKKPEGELARIAVETRSVAVELRNVPNQPLEFGRDGERRVEDDLIAYTWDKFLRTRDEKWPARLPMTKSAVRAMDTVTAFCATPEGGSLAIDQFVVAGGSKRGWTTWTTAAVDRRVVALVPIVIDVLNLVPSMQHHYAAYGYWAPSIGDYTARHIMDWMGTPQFRELLRIEEPFQYRARFTMPKLMLNAAGDQFFLPDSSQFYFDQLPGAKYLRYVPNADHSLKDSDAWQTLQAFYQAILSGAALPRMTWAYARDGSLKVRTQDPAREVKLWQATNPKSRDFRLETFGAQWTSTPVALQNGAAAVRVPKPAQGWMAFLVEFTYDRPAGPPLKLTTPVRVVPDRVDYKFVPQPPVGAGRH